MLSGYTKACTVAVVDPTTTQWMLASAVGLADLDIDRLSASELDTPA